MYLLQISENIIYCGRQLICIQKLYCVMNENYTNIYINKIPLSPLYFHVLFLFTKFSFWISLFLFFMYFFLPLIFLLVARPLLRPWVLYTYKTQVKVTFIFSSHQLCKRYQNMAVNLCLGWQVGLSDQWPVLGLQFVSGQTDPPPPPLLIISITLYYKATLRKSCFLSTRWHN